MRFTWPNLLSGMRLGISVWISLVAYGTFGAASDFFMPVFALACIGFASDWFDGDIARRWPSQRSEFGAELDTVADKTLVCACMYYLYALGMCGAYEYLNFGVIFFREVLLTVLRGILYLTNIKERMPTSRLGKWKMGLQTAAFVGYFFAYLFPSLYHPAALVLLGATCLTLWSGYEYLKPHLERLSTLRSF